MVSGARSKDGHEPYSIVHLLSVKRLGARNHLRRSQDVAKFKSWRGLGELWMEHPAWEVVTPGRLARQAHEPVGGSPF